MPRITPRFAAVLVVLCASLIGCAKTTTVILVRHAERAPGAPDPPLSPAGHQRAATLADVVSGTGLTTIYATNFVRTQQTVAPAAAAAGLTTTIMPVASSPQQHAAEVAARVMQENKNGAALVCNHSNIVHLIAAELGASGVSPLTESEFDRLIIIVKTRNSTRVIQGRYGPT